MGDHSYGHGDTCFYCGADQDTEDDKPCDESIRKKPTAAELHGIRESSSECGPSEARAVERQQMRELAGYADLSDLETQIQGLALEVGIGMLTLEEAAARMLALKSRKPGVPAPAPETTVDDGPVSYTPPPGQPWAVSVVKVDGADRHYRTWFSVGVQHFILADQVGDDEALAHCARMKKMFERALSRIVVRPRCSSSTTLRDIDHCTYNCERDEGHDGVHHASEIVCEWTDEVTPAAPARPTGALGDDLQLLTIAASYIDEWRRGDGAWHAAGHLRTLISAAHDSAPPGSGATPAIVVAWDRARALVGGWESDHSFGADQVNLRPRTRDALHRRVAVELLRLTLPVRSKEDTLQCPACASYDTEIVRLVYGEFTHCASCDGEWSVSSSGAVLETPREGVVRIVTRGTAAGGGDDRVDVDEDRLLSALQQRRVVRGAGVLTEKQAVEVAYQVQARAAIAEGKAGMTHEQVRASVALIIREVG